MRFLFLIYSAESGWTDETRRECMLESSAICDQLAAQGKFVTSSPLEYVQSATSVRVRNGQTQITTGPFAETTEQLGGFYLLDFENLDQAIEVASRLPPAKKGTVEIRPVLELEGLPPARFDLVHQHGDSVKPFLLLCYDDEAHWNAVGPEALHAAMMEAVGVTRQLADRQQYISASPLHPVATATSVRVHEGRRLVSDGPFAETREVLGGYYLILASDQREAESVAARHSGARVGTVEVRPLFDMSSIREFTKI
jgi:hypothetical protein